MNLLTARLQLTAKAIRAVKFVFDRDQHTIFEQGIKPWIKSHSKLLQSSFLFIRFDTLCVRVPTVRKSYLVAAPINLSHS